MQISHQYEFICDGHIKPFVTFLGYFELTMKVLNFIVKGARFGGRKIQA